MGKSVLTRSDAQLQGVFVITEQLTLLDSNESFA